MESIEQLITRIKESASFIRQHLGCINSPIASTAVVLGSGLGGFADRLLAPPDTAPFLGRGWSAGPGVAIPLKAAPTPAAPTPTPALAIPYADIPHFPRPTAPGHRGRLVYGAVSPGGKPILCMQGRFHLYEGYLMREATWHIRVFKELGVSRLILTNACGGMERDWSVGDLMLITDHINYMFQNPLTGPNLQEYGPRFPDMSNVYHPEMLDAARRAAKELSIPLREGVYVGFCGPSYETPAEIRMFRALGASAVGMSTVPEAIVANHCGIMVCGVSCITNYAAGVTDQPLTEAEVIDTAGQTAPVFEKLISRIVDIINK